jgi:hypothetical protein
MIGFLAENADLQTRELGRVYWNRIDGIMMNAIYVVCASYMVIATTFAMI